MSLISSFSETKFNPVTFQGIIQSKIRTGKVVSIWRESMDRFVGRRWEQQVVQQKRRNISFKVNFVFGKKGEVYV